MIRKLLNRPISAALAFAILPALQLLWEHTHGGVVTHYVLHRKDMPAISNWWGLVTIPLLAYLTFLLIRRRYTRGGLEGFEGKGLGSLGAPKEQSGIRMDKAVLFGFLGGLVYGALLASFWAFGLEDFMPPMLLLPLALAFFLPTYRAECLLGFVLAMAWTFGGVLPLAIGIILIVGAWIIYEGIRVGLLKLMGR